MKSKTWARLEWIPNEEGGRRSGPPSGLTYSTAARFEGRKDESWSLVLDFSASPGDRTLAEVSFLVPWAPQELLRPGSKFELLENGPVASGEILD